MRKKISSYLTKLPEWMRYALEGYFLTITLVIGYNFFSFGHLFFNPGNKINHELLFTGYIYGFFYFLLYTLLSFYYLKFYLLLILIVTIILMTLFSTFKKYSLDQIIIVTLLNVFSSIPLSFGLSILLLIITFVTSMLVLFVFGMIDLLVLRFL